MFYCVHNIVNLPIHPSIYSLIFSFINSFTNFASIYWLIDCHFHAGLCNWQLWRATRRWRWWHMYRWRYRRLVPWLAWWFWLKLYKGINRGFAPVMAAITVDRNNQIFGLKSFTGEKVVCQMKTIFCSFLLSWLLSGDSILDHVDKCRCRQRNSHFTDFFKIYFVFVCLCVSMWVDVNRNSGFRCFCKLTFVCVLILFVDRWCGCSCWQNKDYRKWTV